MTKNNQTIKISRLVENPEKFIMNAAHFADDSGVVLRRTGDTTLITIRVLSKLVEKIQKRC